MHLLHGLPSQLSSLLKGQQKQVTKQKLFWMETSACRDGILKNQPNWMGIDTTTLSHHPYILCHFAKCAHHKTLYMHLALPWTRYSALFTPQFPIYPDLPCSAAVRFHVLNSNIPYRLSTAHALYSFCIQGRQTVSAMLSIATRLYIV